MKYLPRLPRRTRSHLEPPRPPRQHAVVFAALAVHLAAVATLGQVISNTTGWIVGLLAGLATLFLTIGGLRYLVGGGDPAEIEKAKTAIKAALIGYAIAVLAPVIMQILRSLVGA